MIAVPKIQDVQTSRVSFHPGDRLLVRTFTDLTRDQHRKLESAVSKFANEDVRILIVNCLTTTVILSRNGEDIFLASGSDRGSISIHPSIANVSCSVIDFIRDDKLTILVPFVSSEVAFRLKAIYKEWAGSDVEVIVVAGS